MSDLGWTEHMDALEATNVAKYGDPHKRQLGGMVRLGATAKWIVIFLVSILLAVPVGADRD